MDVGIYALQAARYSIGKEPISVTLRNLNQIIKNLMKLMSQLPGKWSFPAVIFLIHLHRILLR